MTETSEEPATPEEPSARSPSTSRIRSVLRLPLLNVVGVLAIVLAAVLITVKNLPDHTPNQILNVSYDSTREVYAALDKSFVEAYRQQTGALLDVKQSNGGSGRQARSVAQREQRADVVSLALPSDVSSLSKRGLIAPDWQKRLPNNSSPYTSTIVFVVRKSNPKSIQDWPDLVKGGVSVVTPNPQTSGNGQLSFLAAWGSVTTRGGSQEQARDYLRSLRRHVAVFDVGASGASTSFATQGLGDVHLAWEDTALREVAAHKDELQVVYPPVSIRAEPSVAWVDANVSGSKSSPFAEAYLRYLFTDPAQELFAQHGYRPVNPRILAEHRDQLPEITLFPVTDIAKDWDGARESFFGRDGVFEAVAQ